MCTLLFSSMVFAQTKDRYPFISSSQQQQFQRLLNELRCLVCQNQNLADSQAGLAEDLRNEIYQMVKQEKTDQVIIDYVRKRYGDFVLYRPPFMPTTYLLWGAPILLMLVGFIIFVRFIRSKS